MEEARDAAFNNAVGALRRTPGLNDQHISITVSGFGIDYNDIARAAAELSAREDGIDLDPHLGRARIYQRQKSDISRLCSMFATKVRRGHFEIVRSTVDSVQDVAEVHHINPSGELLDDAHLTESSSPQHLLLMAALNFDRPAGPLLEEGYPGFHATEPAIEYFIPAAGACLARPITIASQFLSQQHSFPRSDHTQWHHPVVHQWRCQNGLDQMWDPQVNNFAEVPTLPVRATECYMSAHFGWEMLRSIPAITQSLGPVRYWDQVALSCYVDFKMQDYGLGYYNSLCGSFTLSPGSIISMAMQCVKPHFYDKRTELLAHLNSLLMPNQTLHQRRTALWNYISAAQNAYLNTMPTFGEDGRHAYCCMNLLKALIAHFNKDDRINYNHPIDGVEWNGCVSVHHLLSRDLRNAHYYPLAEGPPGHEAIIRSKLPAPTFSTCNIIPGLNDDMFNHMKMIKFYDVYRPMKGAELWSMRPISTSHNHF